MAYQLSWLLLLMYGLPSWFDSYKSVDRCSFFSNGALNGLAGAWVAVAHFALGQNDTARTIQAPCQQRMVACVVPPCLEAHHGWHVTRWKAACTHPERCPCAAFGMGAVAYRWAGVSVGHRGPLHKNGLSQEPSATCADASSCARTAQLQRWYNAAQGAYRDAQAVRQMRTDSAVFNTFMFCQIFNMVNARRLHGGANMLHGLHRHHVFLAVCVAVLGVQVGWSGVHQPCCQQVMLLPQVLIMQTRLGGVFGVVPQTARQWTYAALVGAGGLVVRVVVVCVCALMRWVSTTRGGRRGSVLPVEEHAMAGTPVVATPPVAFRRVRCVFAASIPAGGIASDSFPQNKNVGCRVGWLTTLLSGAACDTSNFTHGQ